MTIKTRTKVLVTGASGFVGKQIIKFLQSDDIEIILVLRSKKNLLFESVPNISNIIYSEDVFNESSDWWESNCNGVDVIIHAAWYAEPGLYLQSSKNIDCLVGSLRLAKGAIAAKVKRFIGIGTCFEYEFKNTPISIDSLKNPQTVYAATKLSLFYSLSNLFYEHDLEFAWCRLFYLYGEDEDPRRFVPYLKEKLKNNEIAELTSGKQIRDYLDVEDAGKLIANVALSSQTGQVNICSGVPISIRELAEKIADNYGKKNLLRFGVRKDNLIDPEFVVGVRNIED